MENLHYVFLSSRVIDSSPIVLSSSARRAHNSRRFIWQVHQTCRLLAAWIRPAQDRQAGARIVWLKGCWNLHTSGGARSQVGGQQEGILSKYPYVFCRNFGEILVKVGGQLAPLPPGSNSPGHCSQTCPGGRWHAREPTTYRRCWVKAPLGLVHL